MDEIIRVTVQCHSCGRWVKQDAKDCPHCKHSMAFKDPHFYCCFENAYGRCRNIGVQSYNTTGNGPWYCSKHGVNTEPSDWDKAIVDSGKPKEGAVDITQKSNQYCKEKKLNSTEEIRTYLKSLKLNKTPNDSWATRIMERVERGESLPQISIDMANKVLIDLPY